MHCASHRAHQPTDVNPVIPPNPTKHPTKKYMDLQPTYIIGVKQSNLREVPVQDIPRPVGHSVLGC